MKKLLLLILLVLCGCSAEPDTLGVVDGVAFDKGNRNVCMAVSVWKSGETICVRAETDSLEAAQELCAEMVSRKLFFGHERVIIISEELAREGVWNLLMDFYLQNDKRGSELIAITEGSAAEALSGADAEDIADAIEFASKNSGYEKCTLHNFVAQMMDKGEAKVPVVRVEEAAVMVGNAVLEGGRLK